MAIRKDKNLCEFIDSCPTLETLRFEKKRSDGEDDCYNIYIGVINSLRIRICNSDRIFLNEQCPQYQHLKKSSQGE